MKERSRHYAFNGSNNEAGLIIFSCTTMLITYDAKGNPKQRWTSTKSDVTCKRCLRQLK